MFDLHLLNPRWLHPRYPRSIINNLGVPSAGLCMRFDDSTPRFPDQVKDRLPNKLPSLTQKSKCQVVYFFSVLPPCDSVVNCIYL